MVVPASHTPLQRLAMRSQVAVSTAQNKSSMLQDILKGRATEIEFLTGYHLKAAAELKVNACWCTALGGALTGLPFSPKPHACVYKGVVNAWEDICAPRPACRFPYPSVLPCISWSKQRRACRGRPFRLMLGASRSSFELWSYKSQAPRS